MQDSGEGPHGFIRLTAALSLTNLEGVDMLLPVRHGGHVIAKRCVSGRSNVSGGSDIRANEIKAMMPPRVFASLLRQGFGIWQICRSPAGANAQSWMMHL